MPSGRVSQSSSLKTSIEAIDFDGTAAKTSTIGQLSNRQVASMIFPLVWLPFFFYFLLLLLFVLIDFIIVSVAAFQSRVQLFVPASIVGNKCLSDGNRQRHLKQVWPPKRPVCVPCNMTYQLLQPNKQTHGVASWHLFTNKEPSMYGQRSTTRR